MQQLLSVSEEQLRVIIENRDLTQKQLMLQEEVLERELSKEEDKCRQLFRLTSNNKDTTYEWYKKRVVNRVQGTCQWFLTHDNFQNWLKQESGPLLVTADPGCGKSVLAKYLIDYELKPATICYFFFKDQDQNTVRQALCALLHQLFSQKPFLIDHAMPEYSDNGPGLVNTTSSLWKILNNTVRDVRAGTIIIVLDALDECAESEFKDLIQFIKYELYNNQSDDCKLKLLMTSRPYEQIVSEFRQLLNTFPRVYIPGEDQSEAISQEVNFVIKDRVNQLADQFELSPKISEHLNKKLLEITHRTYLWVYLVFNHLEAESFKKTTKGVELAIKTLPKNVNEAYEQILGKSKDRSTTRKALAIILAACRPLTVSEMNIAVNIQDDHEVFDDLDLEEDKDFQSRLRTLCGLFISIYHGKVYFLHQTAREFLLAEPSSSTAGQLSEQSFYQSITTRDSHVVLGKQCILYLNLMNDAGSDGYPGNDGFLDYSAEYWGLHFREADILDGDPMISTVLKISEPSSVTFSIW
ncbi:hypothetical protein BX600DRAFT_391141, partial [Xylariales sp. PMI_506]